MEKGGSARELTAEEEVELDQAKKKVKNLEVEVEFWHGKVDEAPAGSLEDEEAVRERKKRESQRNLARHELQRLRLRLGLLPGKSSSWKMMSRGS